MSDLGASFNAFSLELSDSADLGGIKKMRERETEKLATGNQNAENNNSNRNQSDSSPSLFNCNSSFRSQLERIGQSSDSEVIHLHSLIRHHELLRDRLQEINLYCENILRALNNLSIKRAGIEEFRDQINGRRNVLMQMESMVKVDEEANENLKKLRENIEEVKQLKLKMVFSFLVFVFLVGKFKEIQIITNF